jgi:hypothetical protein
MEINRYRFTDKSYERAIKVLKGTLDKKRSPGFLKKFREEISLKDGKLFYQDREIIKASEVEQKVRDLLYDPKSTNPWSRDAGYAALVNGYVGISRRKFAEVVSRQRVKRQSDNVPPSQKKKGRTLKKKGQIEIDLYFISHTDLIVKPKLAAKDALAKNVQYYVLSMADKLTSLYYAKYLGRNKQRKHVMKAVREGGKFFAERLGVDYSKLFYVRDAGTEFAPPSELRGNVQKLGPKIEQVNSHAQRILHRLLAAKRGSLTDVVKQSMEIVNNTKSTISKVTPNKAAEKANEELAPLYNKKRARGEPDKFKPLSVGTRVRVVTKDPKGTFYKAYQKNQWSKELYTISKVGKTKPYRYFVNKKWYGRDQLSGPMKPIDQEAEKLIRSRTKKPTPEPELITARTKKKEAADAARKKKHEEEQKKKEARLARKAEFDKRYPKLLKLIKWVEGEEGKDYGKVQSLINHYNTILKKGKEITKELKQYRKVFKHMNYFKHFKI